MAAVPTTASQSETAKGTMEIVELSKLQQVVSRRMSESKATAPHFYLTAEVDMSAAVAARARIKEISAEGEVGFADLRLPPEDHRLIELSMRLRELTLTSNQLGPVIVRPDPATTHQRIIEVLSAVARVHHRKAILL